jgi:hypothetical protein
LRQFQRHRTHHAVASAHGALAFHRRRDNLHKPDIDGQRPLWAKRDHHAQRFAAANQFLRRGSNIVRLVELAVDQRT